MTTPKKFTQKRWHDTLFVHYFCLAIC